MTVTPSAESIVYRSRRAHDDAAVFDAVYSPTGTPVIAREGSLEHFLTERYCLYNLYRSGAPYRLEIHHPPWSLQTATAEFARNTMATVNGLSVPGAPALVHFARRQDMVAWAPSRL
jgi:hypothetical protein